MYNSLVNAYLCIMDLTEKQKEIVKVAKRLISTKGYAETTMRDLADALRIKASSIYSHFSSKEAILVAICEENFAKMTSIKKEIDMMEGSADEKFARYSLLHLKSLFENFESFEIYYDYHLVVDHLVQRKYGMFNYEYFAFFSELVNNVLPYEEDLDCFIKNASVLFVLDALNALPKFINLENPDLEGVAEDFTYRMIYGYHKDMQ